MATSLKATECHVTPVVSASYILAIIKETDMRLVAATSNARFLATFCGTGLYLSRFFSKKDIKIAEFRLKLHNFKFSVIWDRICTIMYYKLRKSLKTNRIETKKRQLKSCLLLRSRMGLNQRPPD